MLFRGWVGGFRRYNGQLRCRITSAMGLAAAHLPLLGAQSFTIVERHALQKPWASRSQHGSLRGGIPKQQKEARGISIWLLFRFPCQAPTKKDTNLEKCLEGVGSSRRKGLNKTSRTIGALKKGVQEDRNP